MTVAAIVAEMGRRGVVLRAEGQWLDCNAPKGTLDAADLDRLRAHKPEILRHLAALTDPAIVVDQPDRAKMMAAVASLPSGPGDADKSGLADAPTDFTVVYTAPEVPAWVEDDALVIRLEDLREAIVANARMGGRHRWGSPP